MEIVRAVILITVAMACLVMLAPSALAYDNKYVHPWINDYGLKCFKNTLIDQDASMHSNYLLNYTLDYNYVCTGLAFKPISATSNLDNLEEASARMSLEEWIKYGGFSADEPEGTMALRHFYDPKNTNTPWLTDDQGILSAIAREFTRKLDNPHISAKAWTFTANYEYDFPGAKTYFQRALEDTKADSQYYGMAWRGVGEAMHMFADMTVPAHVRNDGHMPIFDSDPYESTVNKADVDTMASLDPSRSINYFRTYAGEGSLESLFTDVATYTSENFYSKDTIKPRDNFISYDKPSLAGITPGANGYMINGDLKMAKQYGIYWKSYKLDSSVIANQKANLIPTAIRADAAVLDAFLPRFEVSVDKIEVDPANKANYLVYAHISHINTKEWTGDLTIRNGAHIVVGSKDYEVTIDKNLDNKDNLNRLKFSVTAQPGDTVMVYYNLGGYKISGKEPKKVGAKEDLPWPVDNLPTFNYNDRTLKTYTGTEISNWGDQYRVSYTYYESGTGNVKHGLFNALELDGSVISDLYYYEGKLNGPVKYYYPDGKVRSTGFNLNGNSAGTAIEYNEDGGVKAKYHYDTLGNGQKDGPQYEYFASGAPYTYSEYVNGKERLWREYNEDGTIFEEIVQPGNV